MVYLVNLLYALNMKDELLGLAADPYADPVFRNQHINMDVLYRTGETQQVHILHWTTTKHIFV